MCPECARPVAACVCRQRQAAVPRGDGVVRVERQTQGRKGKGVTVITGLPLAEDALQDLARELKARCGSGGTSKNGLIEIQGDHRDLLVEELKKRGWDAKRSGG
ncbi:MAG: translation initiation factor Sui1 [Methylotetracoccus sp.]|jgi:translation initiation factor 1|nr:translation initiation factor Sui1 [Methylotetracoccus sp.]